MGSFGKNGTSDLAHGNEWAWHRKSRGVWEWHRKPRKTAPNFSMPLLGQARLQSQAKVRVESHAGAGGETSEQANL